MKIKAACIGTPEVVVEALSSLEFAQDVLSQVVGVALGVQNPLLKPSQYYVQAADVGPACIEGMMGVEVRLTGASRKGRTAEQFSKALATLHTIVHDTVFRALAPSQRCEVFCVVMVDAQVEFPPGSGEYTNTLESMPVWVVKTHDPENG